MNESIVTRLQRGLRQIAQKHGALKPDTWQMNGDTLAELGDEMEYPMPIVSIGNRRLIRPDYPALKLMGLTLSLNDYLDPHTVLVVRTHILDQKRDEVVGVIDLTPPAPKPEFNAERDTVINVGQTDGLAFTRIVIPREAITGVTMKREEIRTGINRISRGYYGPLRVTLTLDEVEHAVTSFGQPCILNTYKFYDDPAPAPQPVVDTSWVDFCERLSQR